MKCCANLVIRRLQYGAVLWSFPEIFKSRCAEDLKQLKLVCVRNSLVVLKEGKGITRNTQVKFLRKCGTQRIQGFKVWRIEIAVTFRVIKLAR